MFPGLGAGVGAPHGAGDVVAALGACLEALGSADTAGAIAPNTAPNVAGGSTAAGSDGVASGGGPRSARGAASIGRDASDGANAGIGIIGGADADGGAVADIR